MISTHHSTAVSEGSLVFGASQEAERRQRLAASAVRPLQQMLEQVSRAMFQSLVRLDELTAQAMARPDGLTDASGLCAVQDGMNDALQHCDQLATLFEHLRQLQEPSGLSHRTFDLRELLSQAIYCAQTLLPSGLAVANHLTEMLLVRGDKTELMQALIDGIAQIGTFVRPDGRVELHGGSGLGAVWVEFRVSGTGVPPRPRLALASAIETLDNHRGALDLLTEGDGAFTLRLRLPAAR